jgi:predicted glycosyltransferase
MAKEKKKFLFDIVHPAHVHFFKHIIWGLQKRGHQTAIVARDKDVTCDLLNHYGFDYASIGHSGKKPLFGQFCELMCRDWSIWRIARDFKPDVILTRNPSGVQVARLIGSLGIFDTDDGRAAGILFHAAAPFAHIITTPDCINEDYGSKHVKYPGYKQSAYLHPDHFTPNPKVLDLLGVHPGEKYFLVRFVEMVASHDVGESGLSNTTKTGVVQRLSQHGRVFITSENKIPDEWASMQISIPPHWIHDALSFATFYVGDSQTMACEAAFLGIPNLRVSTFAGRLNILEEFEHRYGLTHAFHPRDANRFLAKLDEVLAKPDLLENMKRLRSQMLANTCNVADWFIDYIEGVSVH